jgi:DNA-binding response OmpR family regulator
MGTPANQSLTMSRALTGCLILVVEDEPLIALDIADSFRAAGAEVVIARTLADAMAQADALRLTAAVIDHALHDGMTTSDVCAKLKERNIPFVVYSGFNKLEGACAAGELVQKPASPQMLVTTLQGVLAQHLRGMN